MLSNYPNPFNRMLGTGYIDTKSLVFHPERRDEISLFTKLVTSA